MTRKLRISTFAICLLLIIATAVFVACNPTVHIFDVTAQFDQAKGSVTIVSASNDGTTDSTKYIEGEQVTVTVIPKAHNRIAGFTVNGSAEELTDANQYVFTVSGKFEIVATFESIYGNVNLSYNDEQGSITLSPLPENESKYVEGTEVTATVQPAAHFNVKSVTVNGTSKALTNGKFTFTVVDTVNIVAEFSAENLPEALFATLTGRMRLDGEYFYDATDDKEDLHHTLKTVYGQDDYIYQFEADADSGEVYYDQIFTSDPNNAGKIALQQIDLNNRVILISSSELYSRYANPFIYGPEATDFVYDSTTADGELIYKAKTPSSTKIRNAASAITGWVETIDEYLIYFKDDKASHIKITTAEIKISDVEYTYHSTYDFDVSEHGTATVQLLTPYETLPEHAKLTQALQQAKNATQYTIRHQATEINYDPDDGADHSDLDYFKYVTANVLYIDNTGWENFGYVEMDGYVFPFTYTPQQTDEDGNVTVEAHVTTDDAINMKFNEVTASFEFYCAAEFFDYVGNNTFVWQCEKFSAAYALIAFAEGTDEKRSYQYGTTITIILDDGGRLSQVKFTYATYGITENVTLTYDFDSDIDLSYLDFKNADHHSVLDPFIGEYKDDSNYVVVDMYGFVINGKEAEVTAYDSSIGEFTAKWEDQIIYIRKLSQRQLIIVNEQQTIFWTLNSIYSSAVSIPSEFKGHWYRYVEADPDNGYEAEYFDFVIQSHAIYYNGTALDLLSYTLSEGVTAADGKATFNFTLAKDGEDILLVAFILYDDGAYINVPAEYVDGEIGIEIPEEYVGTYFHDDVDLTKQLRVDITYTEITINGKPFIPTSYNNSGFVGTYEGITNYTVGFGLTQDQLIIGTDSYNSSLRRIQTISSNYIGTWESQFSEEKAVIIITDFGINIQYKGYNEYFDSDDFRLTEYGYTVKTGWNAFYVNLLYFIDRQSGMPMLMMYDNSEANPLSISFVRTNNSETGSGLPSSWNGTYSGKDKDNDTTITIVIDASGLTVDFGDGNGPQTATITDFDSVWDECDFEIDGETYYINNLNNGSIGFMDKEYSFYIICVLVEE